MASDGFGWLWKGLSFSTMRHLGAIRPLVGFGPEFFPEGAYKVLVVNAPRVFASAWSLIAPLLPKRSRDKVSILSAKDSPAALLECIDASQLPRFLGGEQVPDYPLDPDYPLITS